MRERARRAERLLRVSRRGPWGGGRFALINGMRPVHAADGRVLHYVLETDPWYVSRDGVYKPWEGEPMRRERYSRFHVVTSRSSGPRSRQRWLMEWVKAGRTTIDHALSDCCGHGNDEGYGDEPPVYPFVTGLVPPRLPNGWRRVVRQKRHRRRR